MYLTIEEAAEYLSLPVATIEKLIRSKQIRTVFDGTDYLIYKDQFETHFEQLKKYQKTVEEWLQEPIPEDLDVKDEDQGYE